MALIVQKYGGTSVATPAHIERVAERVIAAQRAGNQLVVVVSAMSGETNRLLALAQAISSQPTPRELDVILATGEQVTIGLLAIALEKHGCMAQSYTGAQVSIRTDSAYNKARIVDIDAHRLRRELDEGRVIVVAGF
ncbi:MAG: aspartate kinase, partial [Chromatiales bacterium]|nr:aspartate kinase [Chromatiales bacterium]